MDDGDVVHVLIKDFVGDSLSISLNDNDGTQEDETEIGTSGELYAGIYGALYNWPAIADPRGIISAGWHIPTDAEWTTQITFLGGDDFAGGELKEVGFTYWQSPNMGATNGSGFSGRAGGIRDDIGDFTGMNTIGYWWTATQFDADNAYYIRLYYNWVGVFRSYSEKIHGYSVRPVKDSTTLLHGQTGTYTGNDGKIYQTICIGTQEWLAQSLAETKFSNGEIVKSEENKYVEFDSQLEHTGTSCTDQDYRIVINFNYLK